MNIAFILHSCALIVQHALITVLGIQTKLIKKEEDREAFKCFCFCYLSSWLLILMFAILDILFTVFLINDQEKFFFRNN